MSRRSSPFARSIAVVLLGMVVLAMSAPPSVSQPPPTPAADPSPMPNLIGLRITPAQARTPEDFFVVFDADDNGCIDRSEWRRRIMAIFYALDTEGAEAPMAGGLRGDEYLTPGEVPLLSTELFIDADLDRDGRISGYEFNQASWTQFEAANPGIVDCLDITVFRRFFQSLRD